MSLTPWVLRLIVANVGVFFLQQALPGVTDLLAFRPQLVLLQPWTIVTYMFVHGGWGHIFFNMFALWIFGPRVELTLGGRRFLGLYLVSGIFGALLSLLFDAHAIVGASGAIFGVSFAYARYWPRDRVYIYGVLPIEVRWLVIIYAALSIFGGFGGRFEPGVAHFAHLGGFLGAAVFFVWMNSFSGTKKFKSRAAGGERRVVPFPFGNDDVKRWEAIPRDELHELNRREVDRLLEKIKVHGVGSLTDDERACLDRFSRR